MNHTIRRSLLMPLGVAMTCALVGCGDDQPTPSQGAGGKGACVGKCDGSADGGKVLLGALSGREDAVARWLRGQEGVSDEDGVSGDFESMLSGINAALGCEPGQRRTYVVSDALLGSTPEPRVVGVACAQDTSKNFMLFMSTPDVQGNGDIDPRGLEMFAWDDVSSEFRFYRTRPGKRAGYMEVEVDPSECAECHMGPLDVMAIDATTTAMMPIMNELTEPWSHWSAEPQFRSQDFELPGNIKGRQVYQRITSGGLSGSAAELEQIIRNAQAVLATTRYKARQDELSVTRAMGLLRPMFCDEQVNYVSERGDSGSIAMSVVLDDTIRSLYAKIDPTGWPSWPWLYDQTKSLRFEVARTTKDRLVMVPTRGAMDQAVEMKFTRKLGAQTQLQIRALDWQNPVLSSWRCGLWQDAFTAFRKDPPQVIGEDNAEVMAALLPQILVAGGVSIKAAEDGRLVVMDVATKEARAELAKRLAAGTLPQMQCEAARPDAPCVCGDKGVCTATLNDFGRHIQGVIDTIEAQGREGIRAKRITQICEIDERFGAKPFLEGLGTCEN